MLASKVVTSHAIFLYAQVYFGWSQGYSTIAGEIQIRTVNCFWLFQPFWTPDAPAKSAQL